MDFPSASPVSVAIPSLAVTLQLLLIPSLGNRIVQKTVENYSMSERAARQIRELSVTSDAS